VRHGAGFSQTIETDGAARTPGAQALDVVLTNRGDREIVSVDVVVQMRSGNSRVMPLVGEKDELGERLPLHFNMSVQADRDAAASWGLASTHAVAYVEIGKVSYRDGSNWSASNNSTCQFTPSPIMLISSR
jgi:hypothetical protein